MGFIKIEKNTDRRGGFYIDVGSVLAGLLICSVIYWPVADWFLLLVPIVVYQGWPDYEIINLTVGKFNASKKKQ